MKIGILGAGNVGVALGRRLARAGHDITVSFARTDDKVAAAAHAIGGDARPDTPEGAVHQADLVLVATPWAVTLDLVGTLAGPLTGKVVWDTTNPFAPDMSELLLGTTTSAGEEVAKQAPGATVVKAVPPFAELLAGESIDVAGHRPGLFVCGDDATARATVVDLATQIGCDPVDAGPLKLARYTEPLGMLVTNLAYVQDFGPRITTVLVRDTQPGSAG